MRLCVEYSAAPGRAIFPGKSAGLEQEAFDHLRINADFLSRGGKRVQAAFGDDFTEKNLAGGNGPVIENTLAQDAAVRGEAVLRHVVPVETSIHRPGCFPRSGEAAYGGRHNRVEDLTDGGLALPRYAEAGGMKCTTDARAFGLILGKKGPTQQPTESRRGEQGSSFEPALISAILQPPIEPVIASRGRRLWLIA